jgi:hypothetical protein
MSRKLICLVSFVFVLSATSSVSADLVAHWRFDEGSGTTAFDSSGNGHDGTFNGDLTWAAGHLGGALQFDGNGDYLTCGLIDIDTAVTGGLTVTAWINKPAGGDMKFCSNRQGSNSAGGGFTCTIYNDRMELDLTNASERNLNRDTDGPTVPADIWVHVSWVYDDVANTFNEYHDGVLADSSTENVSIGISTQEFRIGGDAPNLGRYVNGLIDDLRIYDSALSEQELLGVMAGGGVSYPFASRPSPDDGALLEATWANLGWSAGDSAISHDLYFGTNSDDVNNGAEGTFVGNLATTNQVVGFATFPAPDGLQPGTTYYWRVDEVNDANAASPWKGDLWSFWIPPKEAYEPDPVDGANFVVTDATLTWTPGFGATLQHVYFGDNFDDVNNATGALPQTDSTFTPAALERDKTYYWRVDEFDSTGTTLKGHIWSFTTLPDIAITDPDLVAWWTFDEGQGSTAIDWSGHGNHATLFGSEWTAAALGDAGLSIGDYGAIQNLSYAATDLTEVTVTAWVRTTSSADQYIVSFDRNEYYRLEINGSGAGPGQVGWDVMTSSGQVDYGSMSRVDDGAWHHITGVYDNGLLTIYIDGAAEPSASGGPTYGSGNTRFGFIGANSEATGFAGSRGGGAPVAGEVDDIRIYHRALTQEEIATVMRGDPKLAGSPAPDRDAIVDIRDIGSLNWSKGDTAASHDVYFGQDRDAVALADNNAPEFQGNQAATSLSLASLVEFGGGDYYWRIDEVEADGTVHAGTIWKFTVPDYLIVDDFESYNDIDEGEPGSNRIYLTWIDGFDNPATNGAVAGNLDPPFMSQGRSSAQAMPLSYDNAGRTSEATRTLASRKDWTEQGVTKLSLWFRGDTANAAERMFVALNGNAVVYHDDASATQITRWTEWVIDLAAFGVDLTSVNTITIGFGTKNAPAPGGGTGQMHFDDIVLLK